MIPDFIRGLNIYKPGKPIEETKRELGLKEVYKLASNENPLGPSPKVLASIERALKSQHLYPDPSQYELLKEGEVFYQIPKKNISFGNGTDEIIDFLVRIFCDPNDVVLTSQYAFQAYEITAQANKVQCLKAPVTKDWKFDLSGLIDLYEKNVARTKIIFIANPNNPTGTYLSNDNLTTFLNYFKTKQNVLIVIDEAYAEFARAKDYKSLKDQFSLFNNVVVLRTFSKIFGMAGFRLGTLIGPEEVVDAYNRMRKPFNVNGLAQVAGVAAMQDNEFVKMTREITWKGLDYFYHELKKMNIPFLPSEGNFVLFETQNFADSAKILFQEMLKMGVILRPVDNYGLKRHLRMSVGLERENQRAIECIEKIYTKMF